MCSDTKRISSVEFETYGLNPQAYGTMSELTRKIQILFTNLLSGIVKNATACSDLLYLFTIASRSEIMHAERQFLKKLSRKPLDEKWEQLDTLTIY